MPTKPLERLLYAQGDDCFFCKRPLAKADASVEHLVAKAKGGGNGDDNCVVCCKAMNALFGSMSLKEKFDVVLKQKGHFKCPNGVQKKPADEAELVIANLRQRGSGKPKTVKALLGTIRSLFRKGIAEERLSSLLEQLEARGFIAIEGSKVVYAK
jgi:hypothetical protein